MKRLFVALLVVAAFLVGPSAPASNAAVSTVTHETQAWWNKAGIVVPTAVGQHVHVRYTIPAPGVIVDGVITVPVDITLHGGAGPTSYIRVSDQDVVKQLWPVVLGPCDDCTVHMDLPVNFSAFRTGNTELRITANIPVNSEGNRQYQSTGEQICVRSCTTIYRSPPWVEGRGWYTGHGYQNARLTSPLASVVSGGTIVIKLAPGSGGLATKFSGVYIDPDFHHGSNGIAVMQANGSYSGTVILPVLPSGPHKLVLLASDGQNSGVLAILFLVP